PDLRPREAERAEPALEEVARGTAERLARPLVRLGRSLADDGEARGRRSRAEDHAPARPAEVAARAIAGCGPRRLDRRERTGERKPRGCVYRLSLLGRPAEHVELSHPAPSVAHCASGGRSPSYLSFAGHGDGGTLEARRGWKGAAWRRSRRFASKP